MGDGASSKTCLEYAREGEHLCRAHKFQQGIEKLERALSVGTDDCRTLSAIYCQLGNAYFSLRQFDKSIEYHTYDMFMARALKDVLGEAKACGNIGNAFKMQGSYNDALKFTQLQLDHARKICDKALEARALYNLGSVYHMKGKQTGRQLKAATGDISTLSLDCSLSQPFIDDLKSAISFYEENLAIVEESGDALNCGRAYGNLGNTFYLLREFDMAIVYHNKRLDIAREFGDKSAMRRAYTNLGNAHVFLSQVEKAIEFYRLALSLAIEMSDKLAEAQSCFSLANAASLIADYQTSQSFHTRHLALARELGDRAGEARALASLASDMLHTGHLRKALYFYAANRVVAKEMNDMSMLERTEEAMRELVREHAEELVDESEELRLDGSGDALSETLSLRLSRSLRSLHDEAADCGISRCSAFRSEGDLTGRPTGGKSRNEDFFEFLSRVQSKRMDEQRCDASVLTDVTNRKGPRQTDSLLSSLNESTSSSNDRSARRISFFGSISRVTSASLFRPLSSSTPFSSRSKAVKSSSALFARGGSARSSQRTLSPSMHSLLSVPVADLSAVTAGQGDGSLDLSAGTTVSNKSRKFRVPRIPLMRHKKKREKREEEENRRHSMFAGQLAVGDDGTVSVNEEEQSFAEGDAATTAAASGLPPPRPPPPALNSPEGFIDAVVTAQSRRMDDQRATLRIPGLTNNDQAQEILDKLSAAQSSDTVELWEALLRAQCNRLDDQRCELPPKDEQEEEERGVAPTIADDDISSIVDAMQVGRINEQRAALYPS